MPTVTSSPFPVRRDMSYRKPVPQYVPSPPTSPELSLNQLPLPSAAELPPLPLGWREVIGDALSDTEASAVRISSVPGLGGRQSFQSFGAHGVRRSELVSSTVVLEIPFARFPHEPLEGWDAYGHSPASSLASLSQNSRRTRKRALPQSYRPPTPPLPTHYRRRRLPSNGVSVSIPSMPGRFVFPDAPSPVLLAESRAEPIPIEMRSTSSTSGVFGTTRNASLKTSRTKSSLTETTKSQSEDWYYVPALTQQDINEHVGCLPHMYSVVCCWWENCCNWGRTLVIQLKREHINRDSAMKFAV